MRVVANDLHLNLTGGLVVIVKGLVWILSDYVQADLLYLKMKPRLCDCDECRVRGSVIDMIVIDTDHLEFNLGWPFHRRHVSPAAP